MAIEVGAQVGVYTLSAEVGNGGMATLYRAAVVGEDREVAVKVIHREIEKEADIVEMFLDEARLHSCVEHPNVVRIEAFGVQEGQHYIVMELIDGVTLAQVLRSLEPDGERLPVELAVSIAARVAGGLHAAHEARDPEGRPLSLVHRDVSPQNILLSRSGEVKLIDFGVAKAKHRRQQTTVGAVKGKLAYMAPEQLAGRKIDRRADVFALGTVLWEMLAGQHLFHAVSDFQTLMRIQQDAIPTPRLHRPEVTEALEQVVMTMLARDLDLRFATAAAVRAALLQSCPAAAAKKASLVAELACRVTPESLERPSLAHEQVTVRARLKPKKR